MREHGFSLPILFLVAKLKMIFANIVLIFWLIWEGFQVVFWKGYGGITNDRRLASRV
jgi:hypothetical protein